MTKSTAAVAFGAACDVILLFSVPAVVTASLRVAHSPQATPTQISLLLFANLALLILCFGGACAWAYAGLRVAGRVWRMLELRIRLLYAFFQKIFRATHASVANDAVAMIRKSTVSNSTTPAN